MKFEKFEKMSGGMKHEEYEVKYICQDCLDKFMVLNTEIIKANEKEKEMYKDFLNAADNIPIDNRLTAYAAVKESVKHWEEDILKPLQNGETIKRGERLYWNSSRTGEVRYRGEYCSLCKFFNHDCDDCFLDCNNENSPWKKFVNNPDTATATAMVTSVALTAVTRPSALMTVPLLWYRPTTRSVRPEVEVKAESTNSLAETMVEFAGMENCNLLVPAAGRPL